MSGATGTMPEIIVTKRDFGRLNNLVSNYAPIISWDAVRFLLGFTERALWTSMRFRQRTSR